MSAPLNCVIVGSGPAGYTAAIYAARANMKPVLYTGKEPGGQLMITTDVENFPGYPQGVMGPQMMEDLKSQAERFGTEIISEFIVGINKDASGTHILTSETGAEIAAHTVVISTGASAKWLGLDSEKEFMNKGVSACAVCDGFFFRGMDVAIVGAGDSAAEEALYLSKLCTKVHMIVRKSEMRASKIMQERVKAAKNIEIHWNTETVEITGGEEVEGVTVINNQTQEKSSLDIKGFFVAIGHKPNTDLFKGLLDMDATGYLVTKPGSTHTNVDGIFASGDAQDSIYRQAITAAGTGCMAALDAERYLTEKGII